MRILVTIIMLSIGSVTFGQYHADRHNTSYDKGWISCSTKTSPNNQRGESHWIMYDFSQIYQLGESTIWNANVSDNTNVGVKSIAIDYSMDGITWTEYGTYEVPQADASNFYIGSEGPDLTGLETRYILITALSNYGGSCSGFSEIRFSTSGVVSDVTNIDELEGEILITPNPMAHRGMLTIIDVEPANYILQVTDMSGKVIRRERINVSGKRFEVELDMSNAVRGVYALTISNGEKLKSKSFELIH